MTVIVKKEDMENGNELVKRLVELTKIGQLKWDIYGENSKPEDMCDRTYNPFNYDYMIHINELTLFVIVIWDTGKISSPSCYLYSQENSKEVIRICNSFHTMPLYRAVRDSIYPDFKAKYDNAVSQLSLATIDILLADD